MQSAREQHPPVRPLSGRPWSEPGRHGCWSRQVRQCSSIRTAGRWTATSQCNPRCASGSGPRDGERSADPRSGRPGAPKGEHCRLFESRSKYTIKDESNRSNLKITTVWGIKAVLIPCDHHEIRSRWQRRNRQVGADTRDERHRIERITSSSAGSSDQDRQTKEVPQDRQRTLNARPSLECVNHIRMRRGQEADVRQ